MERIRTGRGAVLPVLVLVSMVLGSLAIPRIATAVGSIVTIQDGASTSKAGVNKAGQLLGSETAPPSIREFVASFNGGVCKTIITVPETKGFILREVILHASFTGGEAFAVVLRLDSDCGGPNTEILRTGTPAGTTVALPLEPGFALAPGAQVTLNTGNVTGEVDLFGYLVPKNAVPASTRITTS